MTWLDLAAGVATVLVLAEALSRFSVTRTLITAFVVALMHAELAAIALVRLIHPPKHAIVGECHRCGACCKSIVSDPPRVLKNPRGARFYAAFHKLAHNFDVAGRGPNGEFLFSCAHLSADDRCTIYWRRPMICRTYPVLPYYDAPGLLPECSYRVTSRVASRMKPRPSLPILNAVVAVHHPTPDEDEERGEHYRLVELDPEREYEGVEKRFLEAPAKPSSPGADNSA